MEKLIRQEYANLLAGHRGSTNQRQEKLATLSAEYAQMRNKHLDLQRAASMAAITGEGFEEAMKRVEQHSAAMEQRLPGILQGLGLHPDYLEPQYDCDICKDTGYVGKYDRRLCFCAIARRHQAENSFYSHLPSFADYDERIFKDEEQREKNGKLKDLLMEYAANFPMNDKPNIFLRSTAGLGKTFMLGCTARAIGERGFSIQMLTAYELSDLFRGEHIEGKPCMGKLKRLDFLVIDDLGVEPMYKNITLEYLFVLLNERERSGKHTAISSNMTVVDLQAKYGERLVSRIMDKQRGMHFTLKGKDLRLG